MTQDELYLQAVREFGPAVMRMARAYEADPEKRRDLLQEMNLALWRSFAGFSGRCSLRTWVYRVTHNVAISARVRRRDRLRLISLDEIDEIGPADETENAAGQAHALSRLKSIIRRLDPPDDQVMLLYLEDLDAASIGEITGLSANAVAIRVHRIKALLSRHFRNGECDD